MSGRVHLDVVQHTAAEHLGLIEDHLEGRGIRFTYHRPFTGGGRVPRPAAVRHGLILLGGGPWGAAGPHNVPTLIEEVELVHACLQRELPVVGFGLGAQVLALAAGGQCVPAPLTFTFEAAARVADDALNGYLPASYPNPRYGRDRAVPPAAARVLARDADGHVALFEVAERSFGFSGHPGFKSAMAEDLVMEFEESPADAATTLATAHTVTRAIEDALVPIMTGLVQRAAWMD